MLVRPRHSGVRAFSDDNFKIKLLYISIREVALAKPKEEKGKRLSIVLGAKGFFSKEVGDGV